MIKAISRCRICGNTQLDTVIDLGQHALTGIFPRKKDYLLTVGPLELVKCRETHKEVCGLLQLRHSYPASELYGDHYGYRSSLNQSMVCHLQGIVDRIRDQVSVTDQDIILDIGSNDGTLLKAYPQGGRLVGIDPAGKKFKKYYPPHIELISDFFSEKTFQKHFGQKKAKIVTSIAMFYDLEAPMSFMSEVGDILDDDGLWIFEQSYMPTMLKMVSYDTICQEHFEYYGLKQIKWMTDRVGFKIIDVEFNATNGGSFLVMAAKSCNHRYQPNTGLIKQVLREESVLDTASLQDFRRKVERHREDLTAFIRKAGKEGKTIFGYGASTKGNVILQYCGLTSDDIPCIGEVNEDKFGCFTPATGIPIIPEAEAKMQRPDYFLVLPWHFKKNILTRETDYMAAGGKLVFPLPKIEVYPRVSSGTIGKKL